MDRWIEKIVRFIVLNLGRILYRVRVRGLENLPPEGGCVLVSNHVSYADTIPLSLAIPRHLRFTSHESLFRLPVLGRCLRAFGSIPVSAASARTTIRRATDCAAAGEAVLIFPEGKLTLDGDLQPVKDGFGVIAKRANCPILMVHIDGLWGSIFSNERGRYFFKWPRVWRRTITVTISRPFGATDVSSEALTAFWRHAERPAPEICGLPAEVVA